MAPPKKTSSPKSGPARKLATRVKTARGRKISSTRWLQRQLNDPFVAAAHAEGYRSRAAFKLIGLDDRFKFLKPGARVADLGAAPGGWCQVAAERVNAGGTGKGPQGKVVGIDITPIEPITDVTLLVGDIYDDAALEQVRQALGGHADVVLSDMAAASTGHRQTDHIRIMALCEAALDFAMEILNPGGAFVAKVLKGGTEDQLLNAIKRDFEQVRHAKPEASRKDSAEAYIVALGFRGKKPLESGDESG
jgi:23S rRNA (uridine2552-2'-O)-methyltransferase